VGPVVSALVKPDALMDAIAVRLDVQVEDDVTTCDVPFEKYAVELYCFVCPTFMA